MLPIALLACTSPPPTPLVPEPFVVDARFRACDLVDDSGDGLAGCADVAVPLDHDDPGGRTIRLRVKRLRAAERPVTSQLWWLHGGPGAKGTEALADWAWLQQVEPSLELLTLDHRGTGGSSRLACPVQEAPDSEQGAWVSVAEAEACGRALVETWGDDLAHITVDHAASDVALLARALRRDTTDRVIVLGASYGSYWAHRVLQLDPSSVDAAWIGPMVPPVTGLHTVDARMAEVFDVVLERCAAEPICSANLGPDPRARVAALHDKLDAGHCDGLVSRPLLRQVSGEALMNPVIRSALLPMIARLDRCAEDDVDPIVRWFDRSFGLGPVATATTPSTLPIDPPALYHFGTSEMLRGDADPERLEVALDGALAATGRGTELARVATVWPRYPAPEGRDAPAPFEGPVLAMHGSLDPTVPASVLDPLFDAYDGPGQHGFVFDGGAHTIVGGTGIPGTVDCASVIVEAWLTGTLEDEVPACFGANDLLRVEPNEVASDFFFGGGAWPVTPP